MTRLLNAALIFAGPFVVIPLVAVAAVWLVLGRFPYRPARPAARPPVRAVASVARRQVPAAPVRALPAGPSSSGGDR